MVASINASTSAGVVTTADTSGILALQTAGTTALTLDASQNATFAGTLTTTGITNSGVATATRFNPTGSSVTGNGMYLPAANSLGLSTNGTNAVYIDSSQNVGIGTTSPSAKLNVNTTGANSRIAIGDTASGTYSTMLMYGGSGKYNFQLGVQNNVNNAFEITPSTAAGGTTFSTPAMVIDSSGNVGIGTTSPNLGGLTRALTLNAPTGGNYAGFELAGAGTQTARFVANNTAAYFGSSPATPLVFETNNTERMRIASTGQVLIDRTTDTASGKLEIYGNSDGAFNPLTIIQGAAGSTSRTNIAFYRVSASATVGTIQTTNTATSYNTSSDYRLKENIAPMTGALAKVAQLKPVTYKWKADGSDGEGFIAHELANVCPHAVSGDKDATREEQYEVTPSVKDEEGNITTPAVMGTRTVPDYQGIDVSFLVATLTAAIQELKAINDTQAETINALTARIVALEGV